MGKPLKLTKAQIREALGTIPIERVLFGSIESGAPALTAKQKAFAAEIAAGETKAGAYRKAYKSKGKPKTVHSRAVELLADGRIQAEVETRKLENEARKSQTPAELREFTIRELERHAQNEDFPPAQRIKCLELLGKITEVALFTERREIIKTTDSGEIRARLMASIRQAMQAGAVDVEAKDLELLEEIKAGATAEGNEGGETPPEGHPPSADLTHTDITHSNPHPQSVPNSDPAHLPDAQ